MPAVKKPKPKREGLKAVAAWFKPEEHKMIRQAAEIAGQSMSTFAVRAAVAAAEKVLAKAKK